jgi:hypothetical protein
MIPVHVIKQYKEYFDLLLEIGTEHGAWEGTSLTKVWNSPDVRMLMPIGTHAIHISNIRDISFFVTDWQELWANNWV